MFCLFSFLVDVIFIVLHVFLIPFEKNAAKKKKKESNERTKFMVIAWPFFHDEYFMLSVRIIIHFTSYCFLFPFMFNLTSFYFIILS